MGEVVDGQGYAGHLMDGTTGLSYMQQRQMDPRLGVFLSVDPVTAHEQPAAQFNRYRYANGNPYKFTDPDGRVAICNDRSCAVRCESIASCTADIIYASRMVRERLLNRVIENSLPISQVSRPANSDVVPLPDGPVGTKDEKTRQQGKRLNNGPLDPVYGGSGDAGKYFETLTGGTQGAAPIDSKQGTKVGDNGVRYRPGDATEGARIDIPAKGEKTHETLHYPDPLPPPGKTKW